MTKLARITCNGKTIRVNPLLHPDRLCYGQECYLRIPGVCRNDPDTVVPAHSNCLAHGKGRGLKARDDMTVPACFWCHAEFDQGKQFTHEEKLGFFAAAMIGWSAYREERYGVPAADSVEAVQ